MAVSSPNGRIRLISINRRAVSAPWVFTVVSGLIIVVIGLLVTAPWAPLVELDHEVSEQLIVPGKGSRVDALQAVTTIGSALTRVIVLGLVIILLLIGRRWRLALFVLGAALVITPLTQVLKGAFERHRPGFANTGVVGGFSFPSGHSSGVALLAGVLVVVVWNVGGWHIARFVFAIAVVAVVAVGYTRIALGAHFLTDVIGGWLLGALVVVVLAQVCRVWPSRFADNGGVRDRSDPQIGA